MQKSVGKTGLQRDIGMGDLLTGIRGIIQQITQCGDQVHIGNKAVRGQMNVHRKGDTLCGKIFHPLPQKCVHRRVLAIAEQASDSGGFLQLGHIFLGSFLFAALQHGVDGADMVGNVMAHLAHIAVALSHELIILGLHGDLLLHQLVAGMELCIFCRAADETKQEYICEDGEDQHHKDNEKFFGRKRVD